jgi:hypothetical protein
MNIFGWGKEKVPINPKFQEMTHDELLLTAKTIKEANNNLKETLNKVTEENADIVKGNTYTWNIRKDEDLKNIKLTFDTDETVDSKIFNFGFFKINVKYSVLAVVGFIAIILGIVLVVYIRNKKNNQI